jgi:hypothetical protein
MFPCPSRSRTRMLFGHAHPQICGHSHAVLTISRNARTDQPTPPLYAPAKCLQFPPPSGTLTLSTQFGGGSTGQAANNHCFSRVPWHDRHKLDHRQSSQRTGTDRHRRFTVCFRQDVLKRLAIHWLLEQLHARQNSIQDVEKHAAWRDACSSWHRPELPIVHLLSQYRT